MKAMSRRGSGSVPVLIPWRSSESAWKMFWLLTLPMKRRERVLLLFRSRQVSQLLLPRRLRQPNLLLLPLLPTIHLAALTAILSLEPALTAILTAPTLHLTASGIPLEVPHPTIRFRAPQAALTGAGTAAYLRMSVAKMSTCQARTNTIVGYRTYHLGELAHR